jgi:hypothetical protein
MPALVTFHTLNFRSHLTAAAAVGEGTDKPPVQLMEDVVLGKVSSS